MTHARPAHPPVAVIGIGCRFPGGINDAGGFWRFMAQGGDAISEIPQDRIDVAHFFDPRPATPGRMMTRWGGFLDGIDAFDADFFGVSPREAERLDPQQRLLLELSWEALEDAGQDLARVGSRRCGVFVGQWLSDFEARLFADPEAVDFFMTTGSGRYASSGRISFALGLRGPSLTIDSACSSSLVAVHLAVQSIRSGESDLALAGGVNVILQPHISVAYSQSRMMAPDGRCKFGDARGDGYVRSEGAGLVVLKPLGQAQADGDRIYAVIRGSAVNNDGRSSGSMGTPSRSGQEDLLRAAYADADVSPAQVGYVEAHGTGTRAGDPVELGALGAVLKVGRGASSPCLVGSVKTNLGHTEGAAGIAGLIKATLALHHRAVPPSLNLQELNPAIAWSEVPFEVPRALEPWTGLAGSRIAGVSAFGIAGTNAHVVLSDESPVGNGAALAGEKGEARTVCVLPLSARSPQALAELADRYADLLESATPPALDRLCWTSMTRRTALSERAVFVAADGRAMALSLREFSADGMAVARGAAHGLARPKVAFVLPGQGAQWIGMARELAAREPVFRSALQACDESARRYLEWSILAQLDEEPASPTYRLDRIDVIQPVLVALAIAYAAQWRAWGIVPDAVVGHSMGEVAAAHIAGVLDLDQAMRIICRRSALMRRTSGKGAMALVELSRAEAEARIVGREALVSVAVSNSPRSSVVSGDPAAISALLSELEQEQIFCRLVKVDVASHSPQMTPLAAELSAELLADASSEPAGGGDRTRTGAALVPSPAAVPIYSTVLGRAATGAEFDAAYWGTNMRRPVLFSAAVGCMLADGIGIFVELGPHPVLLPSIEQTAQAAGADVVTLACGRRESSEQASMLTALGGLWASGFPVDWSSLMRPVPWLDGLPQYPWQRERHWLRAADNRGPRAGPRIEPLQQREREWLHQPGWEVDERDADEPKKPGGRDTWLIVTEHGAEAATLARAFELRGWRAPVVPMPDLESSLARDATRVAGILLLASTTSQAQPYAPVGLLQAALAGTASAVGGPAGGNPVGAVSPRLWLATLGAQQVDAYPSARVDVLQAAMWGAGRVIAEEQPELWGGMVDLDPAADAESNACQLVAEVTSAKPGSQVAYRRGNRLTFRLRAASPEIDAGTGVSWRADSAYLVTGGLGGIGLRLCTTLVDLGVRRLVLMGRSALPPRSTWRAVDPDSSEGRKIAGIRAMESKGASVHCLQADVSDELDLVRALQQYESEGWPAIRGVIHAAGITANQLAHGTDSVAFERVFAPKARGALLLDRVLPDLEIFILFSSISAVLGPPGMANYAAANAALDALAHDRRSRGLHALSIQWGPWRSTGLFSGDAAERNADELDRQGIHGFSPDEGVHIFTAIHGSDASVITVMPVDFAALGSARSGRDLSMFEGRWPVLSNVPAGQGGIGQLLAQAGTPADRRMILIPLVKEIVGGILKLAPSRLDPRRALGTMGLTSLMAMELRNRLEALTARPLSATVAWNYPTIDALVGFLAQDAASSVPPAPPPDAAVEMVEAVAPTAEMTDDDVAELLRRKPGVRTR